MLSGAGILLNQVAAAPPEFFAEAANTAVVSMPNRVTPDAMGLDYPLLCVDVNGNGRDEIVSDYGDAVWRVMEWNPGWQSLEVEAGPRRPFPGLHGSASQGEALLVDATSVIGSPKLYARITNFPVRPTGRYDLRTRSLEYVAIVFGDPLIVHDLDRDGVAELITFEGIYHRAGRIGVYDASMTRVRGVYAIEVGAEQAVAVGNFDDDPNLEIASTAGLVYELTVDGLQADGTFTELVDDNWINKITAADIDADGRDEIVAAYWNRIEVIDHERREVKWSGVPSVFTSADDSFVALRAIDVLGDATPEIVAAQVGHPARPGHLVIFDGVSGAELRTIEHPDIGVYGLNSCDLDGDGVHELIAGFNRPFTGPDRLYVFDAATGQLKWRSTNDTGPVSAAVLADTDGDSREEIVFAPRGIVGVGDLKLSAYDATTFDALWTTPFPLLPTLGTGPLNAVTVGDADGDGDTDLIVGSSQNGIAQIWAVDARTRTLGRSIQLAANQPALNEVRSIAMADVTGDGHAEIVAATSDGFVDVRDRLTGASLWTASWGDMPPRELKVSDLNLDGAEDLVVRASHFLPGQVYIFVVDGATHVAREVVRGCVSALTVLDVLGSPHPEIVTGSCEGMVEVIDASNGTVLQSHNVCSDLITALAENRLSTAGPHELLFACGDRIGWISLATGASRMITAFVGSDVAWGGGLGGGLFSTGSSLATDRILVTTDLGITQLRPVASLAPYVEPLNPSTTNIFGAEGEPIEAFIRFGSFDGSEVILEAAAQPEHGTLTVLPNGQFRYEPHAAFSGYDMIVVRARTATDVSAVTAIPVVVTESSGSPPPPSDPQLPPPGDPSPTPLPQQSNSGGGGGGGAVGFMSLAFLCALLWRRLEERERVRGVRGSILGETIPAPADSAGSIVMLLLVVRAKLWPEVPFHAAALTPGLSAGPSPRSASAVRRTTRSPSVAALRASQT